MADLLLLPLPAVRHVLGNHIEVETRARTKYVVGTLSSVSLDGFDVARDDGVLVHFTWQQVTAAIVDLDQRAA